MLIGTWAYEYEHFVLNDKFVSVFGTWGVFYNEPYRLGL